MQQDSREKVAYIGGVANAQDADLGPLAVLLRNQRGSRTVASIEEESGVSRHTIYRWERGEITNPSRDQLHAVLDALRIPREDAYRELGLLPTDGDAPAEHLSDPDEQAIWSLGAKRGWDEETRMHLIVAWRGRQMIDEYQHQRAEGVDRAAAVELAKAVITKAQRKAG
jgi:transcriptional regulator with XRE-family HTH domain